MNIFLLLPFAPEFRDIYEVIRKASSETGYKVSRTDDIVSAELISEAIYNKISEATLIIADLSSKNPNILYELGLAMALNKPTIILARKGEDIPVDVASAWSIIYDRNRLNETLEKPLRSILAHHDSKESLVKEIKDYQIQKAKLKTVFVSYSHVDLVYLSRLEIHLKPFEKTGQIELWSDTKIKAGEKWKERIESSLNKAAIAILLVSADFLASDFIVDNELPPLLKLAKEKGTIILPVILKPCRFTKTKNLSEFQAINDPKFPLSKLNENDREEIYVKIADHIDSFL